MDNQAFPIRPQAISTCETCKKSFSHREDEKTRDCISCIVVKFDEANKPEYVLK